MSRMPSPDELAEAYSCFGHYGFDPPRCDMCIYQNSCGSLLHHMQNVVQQRAQRTRSNYPHRPPPPPPPPAHQPPPSQEGGVHYHYHFHGGAPTNLPGMPHGFSGMPTSLPLPHNPVQHAPVGVDRDSLVEELARTFLAEAMKRLMNRGG